MIGHYVNNLTPCEEDRLLTLSMGDVRVALHFAGAISFSKDSGCILQVATGDPWAGLEHDESTDGQLQLVSRIGDTYDVLLRRFKAPRVNAAIRNRILSNRARRILQGVSRETAGVGACRFGRGE